MKNDTNISYLFRIVLPIILGIFVGNLLYFKFFVTTNLRTDKVIRDTIIVKYTIFFNTSHIGHIGHIGYYRK